MDDTTIIARLHHIMTHAVRGKSSVEDIQKQLEADLKISLEHRQQFFRDQVRAARCLLPWPKSLSCGTPAGYARAPGGAAPAICFPNEPPTEFVHLPECDASAP
jgi:hypothetical protein